MAEKILVEVFKKKSVDELSQALADPDSRLETGSGSAAVAAVAAALVCRAAAITAKTVKDNDRLEYICRNAEILRTYMVYLIDEDVKSRAPLNRAIKENNPQAIEAARQPASAIPAEIVNMMGKLLELGKELCAICPEEAAHYLAESAELSVAAAGSARHFILDMTSYCSDETYRYVTRRENEVLMEQMESTARDIFELTGKKI